MAKIAIILGRLVIGGVSIDTFHAVSYLQQFNEILIITGSNDKNELNASYLTNHLTTAKHVSISGFKGRLSFLADIKTYFSLRRILKEFRPDIVHTHSAKAGFIGRIAAYHCKVPVIIHTFHGLLFNSYFTAIISKLIVMTERWLAKKTTVIIALSLTQKNQLVDVYKICKQEKIRIIPLGINVEKFEKNQAINRAIFRNKYLLMEDEVAIGLIGRMVPIKNHPYFLKVIGELKKREVKARYFFVGDGSLRPTIQNKATLIGIKHVYFPTDPQVAELTFTSWITEIEMVMAGLDIIALTSLSEGTPLSLMEAQAAKRPVVTVDIGGVSNIVNHNKTGFVVNPSDIDTFCKSLATLILDKNLREKMGADGHEFVSQNFSNSLQMESLSKLYKSFEKAQ